MAVPAATALAQEFPILARDGLVYLDSAATAQKPRVVVEAMQDLLLHHNSNVHRGTYPLAIDATDRFEAARERIARFTGSTAHETIFTKNATEALNLAAAAWGRANIGAGDAIVLSVMEHHSNIVPWQLLAQATGAQLRYLEVDDDAKLSLDQLDELLADGRVRIVAVAHISNVLGTLNPVEQIVEHAHAAGALALIDGAQAVPQIPVDVAAIGADFYAWTGHKAYGPTGVGVLHGRYELLQAMPPFLGGGSMIRTVERERSTYADPPAKFEAGTPPIAEVVGLGAAVDFLDSIGMELVRAHELELTAYALEALGRVPGLHAHGPRAAADRGALISFALEGVHPHDVSEILGRDDICVRAGHHCAQLVMRLLDVPATSRASFAVHNTREDIDRLVEGLGRVIEIFGG
ncbi:MAG TPA: SufS family cysteine desulfurase [Solirubrobacteraceae bacterium]|nr:SufS family cysteine desulfurase [Solirubrobacteraceae bacterium]